MGPSRSSAFRVAALTVLAFVLTFSVFMVAQALDPTPAPVESTPLNLEGKVLAIAGAVFGILQVAKKFFPAITGKWAVLFNLAFTFIGGAVAAQPGQLFTLPYLLNLLVTSLAASGINGKWNAFRPAKTEQ